MAVAAGLVAGLGPVAEALAGPSPQRTVRVRVAKADPDGRSLQPSLSADARFVAFTSTATNLGPQEDPNGAVRDVFVFDQGDGSLRLVSAGLGGAAADGFSSNPELNGDGSRLAFVSRATNLVEADANAVADVFVLVPDAGTVRASVSAGGAEADGASGEPDLSEDGRLVAFTSSATNLVPGDANGHDDVFVRDLDTGAVTLVSADPDGAAAADGDSSAPAISPDGRYVSFSSRAANLVAGDDNDVADVFLRDLETGRTERVSVRSGGTGQNAAVAGRAQISDVSRFGRFVVFESDATNLVAGDRNRRTDVFLRDRATEGTARVSLSTTSEEAGGASFLPSITPDGRFVSFASRADDLVPENARGLDVFVREVARGTTVLADVSARDRPRGRELKEPRLDRPALSADGDTVAFVSSASNLAGGDRNRVADVFLRRLRPAAAATAERRVGLLRGRLLIVFGSADRGAGPLRCRLDDGPPTLCPLAGLLLPRLDRGRHVLRALAGATGSYYATRAIVVRIDVRKGRRPQVRVRNPGDDV